MLWLPMIQIYIYTHTRGDIIPNIINSCNSFVSFISTPCYRILQETEMGKKNTDKKKTDKSESVVTLFM